MTVRHCGAAYYGYIESVKMLVPVSNLKAKNSLALRNAANNGHIECVKLLIPVSDYHSALDISTEGEYAVLQQLIEEYEIGQQQERFNNTLAETIDTANSSVKRKM